MGHEWGQLSVQEQALAQGMAQAEDLHLLLSEHTSPFSNWCFLKMRGYLL